MYQSRVLGDCTYAAIVARDKVRYIMIDTTEFHDTKNYLAYSEAEEVITKYQIGFAIEGLYNKNGIIGLTCTPLTPADRLIIHEQTQRILEYLAEVE